jgi:cytochrome P450
MTSAQSHDIPPFMPSPTAMPSLWAIISRANSDIASLIPERIYHDWALKSRVPMSPIIITHPDDVRQVLLEKSEDFGRNRLADLMLRRAWGKGLAAAEGEDWARQRRAAAPVFRPQAVDGYAPVMADVVRRVAPHWDVTAPVLLDTAIGRIVAEIVVSTLLTGLDDVDYDQLAADTPHFVRMVTTFGMADFLPMPERLLDWLRGMGRNPQEARLRTLVARLTEKRALGPDAVQDLPAVMRGNGSMADNILGTLPAGFETTARAAAWAIWLLARYPAWQDKVREEARTAGEITTLPIARQVAQETMRLYPPAPILVRTAKQPTKLRGHKMRKGQVAVIAAYAMHRHRQLWERPDAFDPARFGPGASYDRGAYIPFGVGPRMCIAAQFALTEIAVIIAELVKLYRFAPSGEEPDVSLIISTHAKNGLWVKAERV